MALACVATSAEAALVAGDGVLVRFQAAVGVDAVRAEGRGVGVGVAHVQQDVLVGA